MKKSDVCLWKSNAAVQGTESLFPAGGSMTVTYQGASETVKFVPMAAGKDGRPTPGLKPEGKTTVWGKIPYGSEVDVVIGG